MARLNEVPASTECIESLKRKFMRQNRDIARVNSAQSLRIRNLENETSRLLAENLGLQAQILRLRGELENGQAQRLADHTQDVKFQLESKLLEIGAIINTLRDDPPRKKRSPQAEKNTRTSPSRSPDQINWKNMCTLSEAIGGQDGKLPTIVEGKSYPRKTLDHRELVEIISEMDAGVDTTGSPEIGSPPVSQFVNEDPVKIDLPQRPHRNVSDDTINIDPTLSINLEQRRKRKDSSSSGDPNLVTNAEPAQKGQEIKGSLKTGAKRKFSVREDEDHQSRAGSRIDSSPDNFEFTRVVSDDRPKNKTTPLPEKSGTKLTRELAVAKGVAREKRSSTAVSTSRKALAPKSINNSPHKATKVQLQDEMKTRKPDPPKFNPLRERLKDSEPEHIQVEHKNEPLLDTIGLRPEPETPAAVDILSPLSQPSTARAETRDTPPPPDLGSGIDGHRPSRRARGAVSYAEPNLRDKMRRPTKDLIDAVTGESKSRQSISSKLAGEGTSISSTIKTEVEEEDSWKRMPLASSATVENSPLRSKAPEPESNDLPSSITTHRKRRESILHQVQLDLNKSGSETAISALIAEHRKAKAAAREKALEKEGTLAKAMEKIDIYDFNGSSPSEAPVKKVVKEERTVSRSSRRQSSIPQDIEAAGDGEASDIEAPKSRGVTANRRRQSTLGLRNPSTNAQPAHERHAAAKKVQKSISMADLATGDTRGDRISARRRSMML
ncbi:Uncharacterized protein BP5553_03486 [Venustampulla echinocandica]|uniref:Shugoshin n=1 Tax=Venustampulla echinocandica TaxID=2656787 RepID=A0A370TUE8_9HELO|nr:Uncharacterized protein BP5553_03486 [Venustampulla echinocandica]RDL39146.1 Uncharacterized protein BP5553_03486 [Venustampulla echinocandica]